ncbi:ABC transporter ATP-binding protein [Metabacillus sp. GX 13764]|nr:ABC transporter ATP-binding protein [Metabacillus kandeliae]MCD7033994.1 ABC transporter ATP-binding protein [Metabacillus kandeliae]
MLAVQNIKKSFNKKEVVKGVTFSVEKGEAFGLLGPNGAGKSTTISMICGLLASDSGDILVGGASVKSSPSEIKKKIGIVPQEIALYPTMSARDNLIFWGRMYGLSRKEAKIRSEEVLEYVGLKDKATEKVETFSGGMKRRINIGAALMHEPELLIMDEPTVGIDPQSRNHILETVKELNQKGMTVIYTSHYMEEVEFLCERIGIIDQGKVIALGTRSDLCSRLAGGTVVKIGLSQFSDSLVAELNKLDFIEKIISDRDEARLEIYVSSKGNAAAKIISAASAQGLLVQSLELQEPNLETLFLQLTGRSLRD